MPDKLPPSPAAQFIAGAELMGSRGRARMYGRPEPEDRDHDYIAFTDDVKKQTQLRQMLQTLAREHGYKLHPRPGGFLTASGNNTDLSFYPTARRAAIHKAWALQEAGMSKDDAWAKIEAEKQAADLHSRFTPDYTPEQLEQLGVYDALYRGQAPRLASLGEWKPEWVSEHDPKGWAQWYKRYSGGRRIEGEDERQIKRWLSFKARHGGPFSKNPTPRRGWALRNWGIDPAKLVPDQAQQVNELLDEHQRKAMQKFVKEKVAAEKTAVVPSFIKMQRRALSAMLQQTHNFHATRDTGILKNILAAGKLTPQTVGHFSMPNVPDVYFGRGRPVFSWFGGQHAVGIPHVSMMQQTFKPPAAVPLALQTRFARPREFLGDAHSITSTFRPFNPHKWIASAGEISITPRSFVVAPSAKLKELTPQMKQLRARPMSAEALEIAAKKIPAELHWPHDWPGSLNAAAKTAELLPDISLQPHQQRVSDRISGDDPRLLVYHGLGSGKSLSAIAAAEAAKKVHGGNYGVVVPASLRGNFQKELKKFTTGSNPEILSYTGMALGKKFQEQPDTLVMDEAQRLRNPESAAARAAREAAQNAKRLVLLSGTPITNAPSDMASLISMLTQQNITPKDFEKRYVGYKSKFPGIIPWLRGAQWGEVPYVKNEKELRKLLQGRVDYQPSKTPEGVNVQEEQIKVPLSKAQQKIQKAIRTKVPPGFLWKLDQEFPLSREELAKMNSFLNGLRQVSLSTQAFRADRDPLKAFDQSGKLQAALNNLRETLDSDKRKKALIYSNFIESGIDPYAQALKREGIPYGVFHGGIPTEARQKALRDYNEGKLRALLIGPAGAEGISTKGTNLIQLLDPHWNEARLQQAQGRGLRFDSHMGLPEDLRNVQVQRYLSGSEEPGFLGKLLGKRRQRTGDEVLESLSANKEQLNEAFRKILREAGTPQPKN